MITKTRLTYRNYQRLPEWDPYEHEMIDGEEFVSPSPKWIHQRLAQRMGELLGQFVSERRLGQIVHPVDLYYDEENYVSPDLSFWTSEQVPLALEAERLEFAPPLVVEVLSKSSVKWDREDKRGFYQRFGVKEYWIVDPFEQTIEVIDLTTGEFMMDDPAASKVLSGFSVSWAALFAPDVSRVT